MSHFDTSGCSRDPLSQEPTPESVTNLPRLQREAEIAKLRRGDQLWNAFLVFMGAAIALYVAFQIGRLF